MNQKEIEKEKNRLMKNRWTEDLHYSLKDYDPIIAKKIVDSMDDQEIFYKVNNRKFQQDYIADYLSFLWEISENSFWKQVIATFDSEEGVLWSDNMSYAGKMCNNKFPPYILHYFLDYLKNLNSEFGIHPNDEVQLIGCLLKSQINNFNSMQEIKDYAINSKFDNYDNFINQVQLLIKPPCNNYLF